MPGERAFFNVPKSSGSHIVSLIFRIKQVSIDDPDSRGRPHSRSPRFQLSLLCDFHDPSAVWHAAFAPPPFLIPKCHIPRYEKVPLLIDHWPVTVFMIMSGHWPRIDCLKNIGLAIHIRIDQFGQLSPLGAV